VSKSQEQNCNVVYDGDAKNVTSNGNKRAMQHGRKRSTSTTGAIRGLPKRTVNISNRNTCQ
jgi:hypothetical protein